VVLLFFKTLFMVKGIGEMRIWMKKFRKELKVTCIVCT